MQENARHRHGRMSQRTQPDPLLGAIRNRMRQHSAYARKPLELPAALVRTFLNDMRAYFAEANPTRQDEITGRQLHALKQHHAGKLRLTDVTAVWIYEAGSEYEVFASEQAAQAWFAENDPEAVAFEYPVTELTVTKKPGQPGPGEVAR